MIRSRLFRKTLIFYVILFGVIANVTALSSAWVLYNRLISEYTSKAVAIARSVAHSDLEIIAKSDAAFIQSKIDQYLDIEGVSYVLVTDADGEVLAHTFIPVIPKAVLDVVQKSRRNSMLREEQTVVRLSLSSGDFIHVGVPVLAGVGGYVHIGMDRSIIMKYILTSALNQQGMTVIIFIASGFLAFFFIRSISMPLTRLTEYANRVANHDFSGTIDVSTNDEIGVLADTMQTMAHDLAALIDNLEMAVADKTKELQETVAYVSAIIGNVADGLLVANSEGRVARSNMALENIFGSGAYEGKRLEDAFLGDGWQLDSNLAMVSLLRQTLADSRVVPVQTFEFNCCRRDGERFPLELSMVCFERASVFSIICIMRDVTERKRTQDSMQKAHDVLELKVVERTRELSRMNSQLMLDNAERRVVEQALRRTEERYRLIFENAIEGIFQTTPDGRILNANPAVARILGYLSPEHLMSEVHDIAADIYVQKMERSNFVSMISAQGRVTNYEFQARRADGVIIWVATNARMVTDKEGRPLYYEGFLEDMTMRKEALDRLEHQAYHDPLTGLPNRLLFQDHLGLALTRSQRRPLYSFAVLYLDLDRFKVINDSLGHAVGDELLCHVARKLSECVRDVDTVARFGGDEFAILLEEIGAPREAVRIARRIQESLAAPVALEGHEVFTSASVGIVLKTNSYTHPQEVLRDADTAMYRAKEAGKSRFKVFNQRMHEEALRLMALETELRKAVERRDFVVHYQPIVDLQEQRICGFEALVRWHHETLGDISPVEFIPLAEDSGLIMEIGNFVLEQAVHDMKKWNACGDNVQNENLFVCVNISGRQFMQPDFAGHIESCINKWNVNPQYLRFEITESILMEHVGVAIDTLSRLRALGLRLCIDDFGTGYSSLSYLQRLPVDTIKIDRSFISQMNKDGDGRSIVRSILSLGFSLGLDVVAEGVETCHQVQLLEDMECRLVQGFLYSAGLPSCEIEMLVTQENPLASLRMAYEVDDFKDASGL